MAVRDEEIAASKAEIRVRDLLIEKLKHQLAGMRRHRFGSSSEALDQLALTLEEEEIATSARDDANAIKADQPAAPKDKPKRKPLPEHLPRNEEILSPGDACGHCGGKLKKLGDDVTEELEFVPGRFVVNRIVRPRMACSAARRSSRPRCPRARLNADVPARAYWPMCWFRSMRSSAALPAEPNI